MAASMVWSGIQQKVEEQFPAVRSVRWEVVLAINLALTWAALTVLYRVVPKAEVRLREAARGVLLAAVLWEVGRQALAAYVLHLNYPTAYGIIGSFIAVMLWAYYAALVILLGRSMCACWGRSDGAKFRSENDLSLCCAPEEINSTTGAASRPSRRRLERRASAAAKRRAMRVASRSEPRDWQPSR